MTEPPEPRRPEDGDGEEDYDATWDNVSADEIMDGLEDDVLMDEIAAGMRGDLTGDELADLLGGLRDQPDAADIPTPLTARAERGENIVPPTEGAPTPMSAQDEATRLRQLATDTTIAGMLQGAADQLESLLGQIQAALGPQHSQLNAALGPIQEAISAVNGAAVTAGHALGNLESIAGQIG